MSDAPGDGELVAEVAALIALTDPEHSGDVFALGGFLAQI
jgi:hypothetical protein